MKPFLILISLFFSSFLAVGQQIQLEHFYPNEDIYRAKWRVGERYYTKLAEDSFKVYMPDHSLQRIITKRQIIGSGRSYFRFVGDAIGQDTLLKFNACSDDSTSLCGLYDETGRKLLAGAPFFELNHVDGLPDRLVLNNFGSIFYDQTSLVRQGGLWGDKMLRVNDPTYGERIMMQHYRTNLCNKEEFEGGEIYDAKLHLIKHIEPTFISKNSFIYNVQEKIGVLSRGSSLQVFQVFDFNGNLRFCDTLIGSNAKRQIFGILSNKVVSYTTTDRMNWDTVHYSIISLQNFMVEKVSVGIRPAFFNMNVDNGISQIAQIDSNRINLYDQDYSLFRTLKIALSPRYYVNVWNHYPTLLKPLSSNDSTFSLIFVEMFYNSTATNVKIVNERQEVLAFIPNAYNFEISQLNGLKDKVIIHATQGTYIYNILNANATSVQNVPIEGITIAPNPFNSTLTIRQTDYKHPLSIHLLDILGRTIFSKKMTANELTINDLGNIPSGVYILSISDETRHMVQKLIKQ